MERRDILYKDAFDYLMGLNRRVRDHEKAIVFFQQSSELGHKDAAWFVRAFEETGSMETALTTAFLELDDPRALCVAARRGHTPHRLAGASRARVFRESALGGFPAAFGFWGQELEYGRPTEEDVKETSSEDVWRRGCEAGDAISLWELGRKLSDISLIRQAACKHNVYATVHMATKVPKIEDWERIYWASSKLVLGKFVIIHLGRWYADGTRADPRRNFCYGRATAVRLATDLKPDANLECDIPETLREPIKYFETHSRLMTQTAVWTILSLQKSIGKYVAAIISQHMYRMIRAQVENPFDPKKFVLNGK